MFSGLIGYRGRVGAVEALPNGGVTLVIEGDGVQNERPEVKDSIAINGVCLTATKIEGDRIAFDVIPETLDRSNLGSLKPGERVNLEYSLRIGDRMGGHFVYGHVDTRARVIARTPEGQGERVRIERPAALARMIVDKAFIAVDGVSLTVAGAGDGWFELALIPETLARTTLGERPAGSLVNLEVDPMARYAASVILSLSKDASA
jgi:riboflavin synthase